MDTNDQEKWPTVTVTFTLKEALLVTIAMRLRMGQICEEELQPAYLHLTEATAEAYSGTEENRARLEREHRDTL